MPESTKRNQIDKDKTKIFIIIAIISVVSVGALMISKGLWSQASYYGKVAGKKDDAKKQLEANKNAITALSQSYKSFAETSPNLLGGSPTGSGDRDGDNAALILDALPNKYDFPALASSVEKLLTGNAINSITGVDDIIVQQAAAATGPVEIPFSVDIRSSYGSLSTLIDTFNLSIRPIQLTRLELSGSNADLQAIIQAKSYYQPELGLQIVEEQVP
jgi:hypothetical protein